MAPSKVRKAIPPRESKGTRVPNHRAYLSEDFVIPPNQPSGHSAARRYNLFDSSGVSILKTKEIVVTI